MEAEIKFDNLDKTIGEFTQAVVQEYKRNLRMDGKVASGNLINSIKVYDDNSISLPDYWVYVEYGRKKGKFPPPLAIQKWVKEKRLKFPGATFLISRAIARRGIKPGHQLEHAIEDVYNTFEEKLNNSINEDINIMLDNIKL